MDKILLVFFIKRTVVVFLVCLSVLVIAEYFKGGYIPGIKLADAVLWSSIASILSSTVATYWAHKKKCKMAYKEQ